MRANIHPGCRVGCRTTIEWPERYDVRRCEHGRLWVATGTWLDGHFVRRLWLWERLSRFGSPILYRRALRALETEAPDEP